MACHLPFKDIISLCLKFNEIIGRNECFWKLKMKSLNSRIGILKKVFRFYIINLICIMIRFLLLLILEKFTNITTFCYFINFNDDLYMFNYIENPFKVEYITIKIFVIHY